MVLPLYTYEVADLRTGAVLGELPLTSVRFSRKLNDSGQFSGQFEVGSRNAAKSSIEDAYDWTTPARRTITVYRDDRPVWGGIIWTSRFSSTTRVVEIGAADYWSYFDHRAILPVLALVPGTGRSTGLSVAPSTTYVSGLSTKYTNTDQNAIARALITQAQAHAGGDLAIQMDTSVVSGILRDREYPGHQVTNVGDALRKLSGVINGPDIVFDLAASVDAQGRPVRRMLTGAPNLGQVGSVWVWELESNLIEYTWPRDGTRFASRALGTGDGAALAAPIAVAEDTTLYTAGGWPLMETESQWSGVVDPITLQDHATTDQILGRRPVVLPTLVVRGDMSPMVGEWNPGDDGHMVVEDDWFPHGLDAPVRIITAEIAPSDDTEIVTFTCSPLVDEPY